MSQGPIEFFEWYSSRDAVWKNRPWLVVGKGPTFALLSDADISDFNIFGLNHVVMETRVDIAHAIDIDVVVRCSDVLPDRASHLLMPWIPHTRNRPSSRSLVDWMSEVPVLGVLAAQGRLLWYNKSGSPAHGSSPEVDVRYFSAEVPYALLGKAGVKRIRSLGIDGGKTYSSCFNSLPTLLSNRRNSFDRQFDEIAKSIMAHKMDAAPLNLASPIRIFVAATEEQMLSVKVLEYSIRKHASMNVAVTPLHQTGICIPTPRDVHNRARTPFSFQRFLIPEACGNEGRAIYMDSDMQVFSDVRKLWELDMEGHELLSVAGSRGTGRRPQYSVMLLDCGKLRWRVDDIVDAMDAGHFDYEELMEEMVVVERKSAAIPAEWNSLEYYVPGKTKLTHYTDMNTQPWVTARHAFGHVWVQDLLAAIEDGQIDVQYVDDHVQKGWVRPSLGWQVKNRVVDPMFLPRHVLALDRNYSPPYRQMGIRRPGAMRMGWRYANAVGRRLRQVCAPWILDGYRSLRGRLR